MSCASTNTTLDCANGQQTLLLPRTEYRRPDANVRAAEFDGHLEVARHAHAELERRLGEGEGFVDTVAARDEAAKALRAGVAEAAIT